MAIESWVTAIKLLSNKSGKPSYYRWRNIGKPAGQFHIRRALMRPTQERLVRLVSLGSGPDRPLLGLFKSSSGTLGIWNGQHEAHFARRGPIGTNVSLLR